MGRQGLAINLVRDLSRMADVAGPAVAGRYAVAALATAPSVARERNLNAVDRAMGGRSWTFQPVPGTWITLPGPAFGGAREMYCRGVYWGRPGYAPAAGENVVDLGANQGLFSVFAAAAGARVLAVEAQRGFGPALLKHAKTNRCSERITLVHALVGASSGVLADESRRLAASHWEDGVPQVEMETLLAEAAFDRVDLMKIDIEGSEYALFQEAGWLDRVGRVVMEVHTEFGDPATLLRTLRGAGFNAVLLDNALRPTARLADTSSGYLYARRDTARSAG